MSSQKSVAPQNDKLEPAINDGPVWRQWSDDRLLDLRLCDLGVTIEHSRLKQRVERLYEELERRNILFRPHVWLSSEWFSPDGIPGIALPFYLAHPRLMRLEDRQMLVVEGGTEEWCMRLLRHEAGHAIDTAYRLRRRKAYQKVFGRSSVPYPEFYSPKPYSKRYVLHLDWWYAQSHPTEDFAETFAVWLRSGSRWRTRYRDWPAIKKLQFVDILMRELAGTKPLVTSRGQVEPLRRLRLTLREYYQQKRAHYESDYPEFYDQDLRRLFSDAPEHRKRETASSFLRRVRPAIRQAVSRWTGEHPYSIDQVLGDMITRCRALRLRVGQPENQAELQATIMVTAQTMHYLYSGRFRVAV